MKTKILFVNCNYNLFDKIDCGAGNRSTLFIKSLAQIGDVDVISFSREAFRIDYPGCKIIYQKYIPNGVKPSTPLVEYTIVNRIKSFLDIFWGASDPYRYYYENDSRKEVVESFIRNGHYDFISCRYIIEAVSCGLLQYSDRLILDVDDNLVSAAMRDSYGMKFSDAYHKWRYYREYVYNLGIMSKHVLKSVMCSFYSNIAEPTSKQSVFLPNVTVLNKTISPLGKDVPHTLLIVGWLDFSPNRYGAESFDLYGWI